MATGQFRRRGREIALVLGLVALVHHGVAAIPYAYSEIAGIEHNRVVTDFRVFAQQMLTPRGLLERPLSVLSYTVGYALHGDSAAGFHWTNLAIHGLNTALVYLLAQGLFVPPLAAALVFGLHPLATACVGQIFGRNYSLATTFFLLAFCVWLRARAAPATDTPLRRAGRVGLVVLLGVLATLTKQSFVMLPLVLAWYEIGARNATPRDVAAWLVRSPATCAAVAASVLVAAAFVVLYAIPLSRTAAIPPGTFALSEIANAPVVARFFVLPYQTALVHDLLLYRGFGQREVWLGLALLVALAVAAWRWRARPLGWTLGALLLCLLPTNSVLPKNEIVREWRLYPSLVFYALGVAEATALAARRARASRWWRVPWAPQAALAAYLVAFARADVTQNRIYQSGVAAWTQVLGRYPYSADAMNNLGIHHAMAGESRLAARYFAMAMHAAPEVSVYPENLSEAFGWLGRPDLARKFLAEANRRRVRYGERTMTLHYR